MLGRGDVFLVSGSPCAHRRQAARLLVLSGRRRGLPDRACRKPSNLTTVPVARRSSTAWPPILAVMSTVVRSSSAEFHLARDRARPDQLVELCLVGIEIARDVARTPGDVGRPDRLMRFLGVLRFGLVAARRVRDVACAVFAADQRADRRRSPLGDLHAVGSHIGDEADRIAADVDALVEPLRDPHGVRRRKAELAACLLLQGRGGEGRIGIALGRLASTEATVKAAFSSASLEGLRVGARADVEPLDLLPIGTDQAGLERSRPRRRQCRDQRPVFARRRISRSRARGRRRAAAPPIARGRPSARPAACAKAPARA